MQNVEGKLENIHDNFNRVIERINKAAIESSRDPASIRLVVVTKTHPVEVVKAVVEAGARDLGENYVEEAIPKIQALTTYPNISWHMIGHIQSRKAQLVVDHFQYVHSLDSLKLAERLSRYAVETRKLVPVWMEFNIGGEETKSGWNITNKEVWASILPDMEYIFLLPSLEFLGVMTIPPYSLDPEKSRSYYRKLREFQEYVIAHFQLPSFKELSMGMSSDFEVAIQEGSTCIRIGQAILGPRH